MIRSISIEIVGGRTLELINTWYKLHTKAQSLCFFLLNRWKYKDTNRRLDFLKGSIIKRVKKEYSVHVGDNYVVGVVNDRFFKFDQDGDIVSFKVDFMSVKTWVNTYLRELSSLYE